MRYLFYYCVRKGGKGEREGKGRGREREGREREGREERGGEREGRGRYLAPQKKPGAATVNKWMHVNYEVMAFTHLKPSYDNNFPSHI